MDGNDEAVSELLQQHPVLPRHETLFRRRHLGRLGQQHALELDGWQS